MRLSRRPSALEMSYRIDVRHQVSAFVGNETRKIAILVSGNLSLMMDVVYAIVYVSLPFRTSYKSVGSTV
jgi:hypothetical protein